MEQQVYPNVQASRQGPQTNGMAITALVLGVLSLTSCGCFTAIPAIICGNMALGTIRGDASQTGGGMAKAGIICGFVSLGLTCLVLGIYVVFFGFMVAAGAAGAAGSSGGF